MKHTIAPPVRGAFALPSHLIKLRNVKRIQKWSDNILGMYAEVETQQDTRFVGLVSEITQHEITLSTNYNVKTFNLSEVVITKLQHRMLQGCGCGK